MRPTARGPEDPLEARLSRFGFGDPWDSWMDRIRELEWPRTLGRIGPYELLGEAGRGGQGIVYRARLTTNGRIVALKKLLGGTFASAESQRRLEREMEAAAALSCEAIVRVLGMDVLDGQPLLAMEWVEGEPITAWARGRELAATLRTFVALCEAVQHAHQRGVLHRDLKPSNILVDRDAQPRILDFGLAKLTGGETLTRTEQFMGTPGYAAPEQLGDASTGDVRSDVYALGVVLYEILTGSLPFRHDDGCRHTPEAQPARPSGLNPQVAPALEAITLRAIEHDPARRYQSAGALADDVRRFLAGEPVDAQGPGLMLRAGRFVRRHRFAAAFAGTVAVLLIGWGVVAGALAIKLAARTEDAREAERRTARINAFLIGLLGTAHPTEAGADAGMLVAVDKASSRVDAALADDPLVCAGVHSAIGRIYLGIRMTTKARTHLQRAVEMRRAAGRTGDREFTDALRDVGESLAQAGDPGAVGVLRHVLDRASREGDELRAAACALALGDALGGTGDEAESIVRDAVARFDEALGPGDPRAAAARVVLGACLNARDDHAAALDELDRAAAVLTPVCDLDSVHMPVLVRCEYERASALLALGRTTDSLMTLLAAMPAHHCLHGGTRDGEWLWRWAVIGHADHRVGTIEKAHEALSAAWRHGEPPVGPFAGIQDWSGFFASEPLGAEPAVYARRVLEGLAKIGGSAAEQTGHARWLAARLEEAGSGAHATAIRETLGGSGTPR